MVTILIAIGLLLAAEGLLYALGPAMMKRMAAMLLTMPEDQIRQAGIVTAALGAVIVFVVARFLR